MCHSVHIDHLRAQRVDPSSGAANATGAGANGWAFWPADTPEGQVTLAELRATLSEEN